MKDLAAADYTEVPVDVQAEVLRAMHQVDAGQAAVFGRAGWAFVCEHGYDAYAQKNIGRWHVTQARVTRAAGFAAKAWIRRYEQHPLIVAALADQDVLSESWARQLSTWSDKLPEEHQPKADEILVTAARAGVDLAGLAKIAAELAALLTPSDEDKDREPGRGLRLEKTFEGAGVLTGDLTPSCAAMVDTVLGALSQYDGKEDLRTSAERMHDALEEAMRRLLAARLLPQRAGAPVTALVHISLADLLAIDPDSVLSQQWVTWVHAQWMAERAVASVQPGDHGTWLHGKAAAAAAGDAMIVPMVTGTVDISILDHLVDTCLAYAHLRDQHDTAPHPGTGPQAGGNSDPDAQPNASAVPLTDLAAELARLEKLIIGDAVALMSGEGGLASFLRRQLLGKGLDGPSLPLDVGDTDRIPPHIRRAVTVRDRHCAFPGGCDRPAWDCEPHHCCPRTQHGPTSITNLTNLCWYHHHVVVHERGWTVQVEPDGTITARRPDGTLFGNHPTIFSNGPPPRPGWPPPWVGGP
jgi:hypothetical protein